MKSKLTQRRYRAPKRSACGLCKPQQRGWSDKKTVADLRRAVGQKQQIREMGILPHCGNLEIGNTLDALAGA
jgi:hypothetical protein